MENNINNYNMDNNANVSNSNDFQQQQYPPQRPKDVVGIIVGVVATIIIIGLAGFYYYAMTNLPIVSVPAQVQVPGNNIVKPIPEKPATKIIVFAIPEILPSQTKAGYCLTNSVAAPYRQDAWRCMVGNEIFDPCFAATGSNSAFCQPDPNSQNSAFLITPFTKSLPKPSLPTEIKDNRAWYLELQDGTFCSPYMGTSPFINGKAAYYSCQSKNNIPAPKITDNLVPFGHIAPSAPRLIDTIVIYSSFNPSGNAYDFNSILRLYRASNVSPHYFIDRQGNIYRVVEDKDIAYHAGKGKMPDGRTGINNFSIAVNLIYKDTEEPNDEQYLALNGLLQILEGKYSIKNVVTHGQISTAGKSDPWNFESAKIVPQEQMAIIGELKKGLIWTATKGILTKSDTIWTLKSSEEMNIKNVWQ